MTQPGVATRRWRWDRGSIDQLHILESPDGMMLRGEHGAVFYWLFANAAAETQWFRVIQMAGTEAVARIDLERRDGLWWHKDGDPVAGSAAALDPDIACTAATNSLALRRLNLGLGQIADLAVLYVPVPDLRPRIVHQRYLRHRGGYTYENPESGFSARLTVDDAGWVRDYPGVCQLVET